MIKTINLQKIFKTEEVETWALNNVSIEVKQGEFVAIMGPSGCGNQHCSTFLVYWTIRQEGSITSMEQKFPSTQSHSVPAFVKE